MMDDTKTLLCVVLFLLCFSFATATSGSTTYSCFQDAEELDTGTMSFTSTDLEMPLEADNSIQKVGLRYVNIDVPPGATIDSAFITFQSEDVGFGNPILRINAQRTGNAGSFLNQQFYFSNLPLTFASVIWTDEPIWASGSFHNSPQLRTIIQEVVDRSSWQRFNSIAIIIRRSSGSTGRRIAESIEGSGIAPRLTIQWTLSTPAPTRNPTREPTRNPTNPPTRNPTREPTRQPTVSTSAPTREPTASTPAPSNMPTLAPVVAPTRNPTVTATPSSAPTQQPTQQPTGKDDGSAAPTAVEIIQVDSFIMTTGALGSILFLECCSIAAILSRRRSRNQRITLDDSEIIHYKLDS